MNDAVCLVPEVGWAAVMSVWGLWAAPGTARNKALTCHTSSAEPAGFFAEMTEDEMVVLQQMFFGVIICALATLAAKGDLVFTAIFIGAVAAMTGYWLSERSDRVLEGFIKGR